MNTQPTLKRHPRLIDDWRVKLFIGITIIVGLPLLIAIELHRAATAVTHSTELFGGVACLIILGVLGIVLLLVISLIMLIAIWGVCLDGFTEQDRRLVQRCTIAYIPYAFLCCTELIGMYHYLSILVH